MTKEDQPARQFLHSPALYSPPSSSFACTNLATKVLNRSSWSAADGDCMRHRILLLMAYSDATLVTSKSFSSDAERRAHPVAHLDGRQRDKRVRHRRV